MMCSYFFPFSDYMAHLVEVQHERGATGGQTFHSLLTASLPARRGTVWDSLNFQIPALSSKLPSSIAVERDRKSCLQKGLCYNKSATCSYTPLLISAPSKGRNSSIFGVYYNE